MPVRLQDPWNKSCQVQLDEAPSRGSRQRTTSIDFLRWILHVITVFYCWYHAVIRKTQWNWSNQSPKHCLLKCYPPTNFSVLKHGYIRSCYMGHAEGPFDPLSRFTLRRSLPSSGDTSQPATSRPLAHLVLYVLWNKSRHSNYGWGYLHLKLSEQRLVPMDIKG